MTIKCTGTLMHTAFKKKIFILEDSLQQTIGVIFDLVQILLYFEFRPASYDFRSLQPSIIATLGENHLFY